MTTRIGTVLGPVTLHERKIKSKTSGQVLTVPSFDSRLIWNRGTLTYNRIRTIRNDPTIQLARQAVLAPMIHTPWTYKESKDAPFDAIEFIKGIIEPERDWFLQNAVYGALDFGWAPFEIVYGVKDERNIIVDFKQLLHDYTTIVVYVESGRFAGFINEPTLIGVVREVLLLQPYALNINLMVEGTDWYGLSVSSVLTSLKSSWDDVDSAANRYDKKIAGATWVVYYPVGTTPYRGTDRRNDEIAEEILSTLEASGAVAIPDEIQEWLDDSIDKELKGKWRIELITTSSSTQSSFIDRLRYLDTLKIRAFGMPERAILEGKFGTKAEAETHSDIALSTVDTKHRLICDQFNKGVIRPLLRMNYGEQYQDSVYIIPAPLVDAQFQTAKEIYRLIVQSPTTIERELENINVPSLREQIGIPSAINAPNDYSMKINENNNTNNIDTIPDNNDNGDI